MVSAIFASELDSMLADYAQESDLSHETRVKESGTTQSIIFTRSDLDNLQYQTLKDVLSMQRFTSYKENRFGETDLFNGDPMAYGKAGQLVKIFIDDHELSSAYLGSGIAMFGNIDLAFVDHIEMYQGPAPYEFVTDSSLLTIKLYSKTAARDSGKKVGLLTDNYGGHQEYFHIASNEDRLKYFVYLSNNMKNRDALKNGTTDLSRDEIAKHLYSTFIYDDNEFVLQYLTKVKDGFLTNSIDATPTKDNINNDFLHLGYKTHLLNDDSLELKASYDRLRYNLDFMDDNPFFSLSKSSTQNLSANQLTSMGINPTLTATLSGLVGANTAVPFTFTNPKIYGERYERVESIASLNLQKVFKLEDNTILLGAYVKQNKVDFNRNELVASAGDVSSTALHGALNPMLATLSPIMTTISLENNLKEQSYYSSYLQDTYKINENNSIIAGVKLDYEANNYYDNKTLVAKSISHIYKKNEYSFTTFYSYLPLNKIPSTADKAISSSSLENEALSTFGHEAKYVNERYSIRYSFFKAMLSNLIRLNGTGKAYNASSDYNILGNAILFTYYYNKGDSLMIEPWREDMEFAPMNVDKYYQGVNVRAVNNFNKVVFLNEYRFVRSNGEADYQDGSWLYNLGATYKYTKDLNFFLKGENIFDSLKGERKVNYNNGTDGIVSIERRLSIGMGYTF